jgi:hypothetical protein
MNIEYTIIMNPINANRPKIIDLISLLPFSNVDLISLLPFSNVDPFLSGFFDSLVSFSGLTFVEVD